MNNFKLDLLFYGNTFIPLSCDCNGCHNFNYLCEGSVYREECPIGQVEDISDSKTAALILKEIDYNHFLLARISGIDLLSNDMKTHIADLELKIKNSTDEKYKMALKKAIKDYNTAIGIDEKFIESIDEKFIKELEQKFNNMDLVIDELEEYNVEEYKIEENKDIILPNGLIYIDEDHLPF